MTITKNAVLDALKKYEDSDRRNPDLRYYDFEKAEPVCIIGNVCVDLGLDANEMFAGETTPLRHKPWPNVPLANYRRERNDIPVDNLDTLASVFTPDALQLLNAVQGHADRRGFLGSRWGDAVRSAVAGITP